MQNQLWIVWDLLAAVILAYYIYRCARRGFLRTVVNFIGYVASAVLAGMLSPVLAQWTYDVLVRDMMRASLTRRVEEAVASGGAAAGLLEVIPGWMQNVMNWAGSWSGMPGAVTEFDASGAVELLIDSALADPVLSLLQGVFFFLLLGVFSMVARRIASAFTGVNRIPLIGTVNTFLGGVLGVFQAALVIYLVAVAVRLYLILSGHSGQFLSAGTIEAGFVFRYFWRMSG